MAFFAMMFLFFVFMRFGRFQRMRRGQRAYMCGRYSQRNLYPLRYAGQTVAQTPAEPHESAYEKLKRRYVRGELSDYQYETELDELLKTPEGRRQV
jgi:hypothetical protein